MVHFACLIVKEHKKKISWKEHKKEISWKDYFNQLRIYFKLY